MRLPKPFYRLPIRLNVERLRAEVAALPDAAWVAHPNDLPGNSAARLISAGGGENDDVVGQMLPTPHLRLMPYVQQVLRGFAVVWSRSRLMRLDPKSRVPEHADINYHWYSRVRIHMPVVTNPAVRFVCGSDSVHMAAGEVWVFDSWRLHYVENPSAETRIHLVADTTGSASFWQLVASSELGSTPIREVAYVPTATGELLTERNEPAPVMVPAEVDSLLLDLRSELTPRTAGERDQERARQYDALLAAFSRDWRQLYALHGTRESGWGEYARMAAGLRQASKSLGDGLVMRANHVPAHRVLEGRVLTHLVQVPERGASPAVTSASPATLSRPVFIVSAPRSGSTLLYETLAVSQRLHNLGGEAHWLFESLAALRPGAGDVDSNRLVASHWTPAIARAVDESIRSRLLDSHGAAADFRHGPLRLLEKTPKNALRIPFLTRLFPDAQFIFLWRDPRENISSIMEAWRSGAWVTYRDLEQWDGPWSMLLPPGWQWLRGQPLEAIAAYQWDCANRIILEDLLELPPGRSISLSYQQLLQDPRTSIRSLADFIGVDFDAALSERVSAPLPLSRYTQTPPREGKWRSNAAVIESVLPKVHATWQRLLALAQR